MFDLIDQIMNLDIAGRGVRGLYEPARARASEPLCVAAARHLTNLKAGDHVFIITGSLTRAWVSANIGENDGPIGTATLVRALSYGFSAIPVVLTDASLMVKTANMVQMAGCTVVTDAEARIATANPRFTSVAVMATCATDDAQARSDAKKLVDQFEPKAVISVERAGLTADGTYRNMLAQDFTAGRARLDHVVTEAATRGVPTIGVGDGGNEIGMGAVKKAVAVHIPHGDKICAEIATDVLLPCGVSNWGCYAIEAALAILTDKPELAHTAALEKRLIESSPHVGLVDGALGKLEATVDGLPLEVHVGIVELLAMAVRRGLRPQKK
jgi:hypothetical protein